MGEIGWRLFINSWKKDIYQKEKEMDLTFWYGSNKKTGLKEIMRREDEENIANGGSKMMPAPIMTEDMMKIIKRQKNGKAVGTDGVKAETMKHMVRNKKIRKGLVVDFNRCLKEKVNEKWLESYTTMLPKSKKPGYKDH